MLLAHLSDLHLGAPPRRKRVRRIMALIDCAVDEGIDHLMLGGDLVDSANLHDFDPIAEHLQERGVFAAERLSVVPGNHDVWPFSESHLSQKLPGILADDLTSLLTQRDWPAQHRYEEFAKRFASSFEGTTRGDGDCYPCVKVIGNLAIAMLDTTSNAGYFASAQGHFDREEGRFLRRALESHSGPRVLLMHHVPWRIGGFDMSGGIVNLPWGVRDLVRVAVDGLRLDPGDFASPDFVQLRAVRDFVRRVGFDAVFCGHVHSFDGNPRSRAFRGRVGDVPIYCMGRSGAVHQEWEDAVYAYHLVTVDGCQVNVMTRYVEGAELDRRRPACP